MARLTLRFLAYPGLAFALVASDAEAGVGAASGGTLSSFARLSAVQTVQYDGGCWYDNGWNGPGYYPCGNEWNSRPDTPSSSITVPPFRGRHRHGVVVAHPKPSNQVNPGAPSPRLGVGAPSNRLRAAAPAFGAIGAPSLHRFGAAGVPRSPGFHAGAATVAPGLAGAGTHSGFGGGNFHQFHGAGVPRIGASVSPGLGAGGGFHGLRGAGNFHGLGGAGAPRIGAPASTGLAGPAIPSGAGRD
jgi:hypothetical protein